MLSEALISRLKDVLNSEHDLSYQDELLLADEAYGELATKRLQALEQKQRYAWILPAVTALIVLGGVVWSLLAVLGVNVAGTLPGDRALPLFTLLVLTLGGTIQLWRQARTERKRMLFEIIVDETSGVRSSAS